MSSLSGNSSELNDIPIVDLEELPTASGNDSGSVKTSKSRRIGTELDRALRSHTCAFLKGTGIPEKVLIDIFEKSKAFFELPSSTKGQYSKAGKKDEDYGGYYVSTKQSFRERFDFILLPQNATKVPENEVPGITSAFEEYHRALNCLAKFTFSQIEAVLGLPADVLLQCHKGALLLDRDCPTKAHLTSLYYRTLDSNGNFYKGSGNGEYIMDTHTDYSSMTLVVSSAPGLQVQLPNGSGRWVNADPVEGCIFLHVGDLLERLTGGIYRATVHRVKQLDSLSHERQTIPYFIHPDASALVQPLITTTSVDRYIPIIAGEYWNSKMQSR